MTWDVGLDEATWSPMSQLDGGIGAVTDCAMTCLAMVGTHLTGWRKSPRQVHDEYWGDNFAGKVDLPAIQQYAKTFMQTDTAVYYAPDIKGLASNLYNALYWKRPVIWLSTLDGVNGHWEAAVHMAGASGGPFDNLRRSDPWFGQIVDTSYSTLQIMAYPYYANQQYVAIAFNRVRSIKTEVRFGA